MILLGRPKNGDIIRAQLRIKESKEFKVGQKLLSSSLIQHWHMKVLNKKSFHQNSSHYVNPKCSSYISPYYKNNVQKINIHGHDFNRYSNFSFTLNNFSFEVDCIDTLFNDSSFK